MKVSDLQEKIIGIYKINFPNGKVYIGLTNNIKRRMYEHFSDGRNNMACHKAVVKYFSSYLDIDFEVLERLEEEDYQLLSELEKKWIAHFKASDKNYGYNLTEGGIELLSTKNPFSKFSEEDLMIIRRRLMDGNSNVNIAKDFKVHPDTISHINTGKKYFNPNLDYPLRKSNNNLDRSGFNNENAITKEQFEQIVNLLKTTTLTTEQISKKVGVHSSTICEINQGKRSYCPKEWKYPLRINNQNKTKLSKEDILTIHEKLKQVDLSIQDIANYFSCSRDTIADINRGKRHKIEGVIYPIRTFYPKRKSSPRKPVSTITGTGE